MPMTGITWLIDELYEDDWWHCEVPEMRCGLRRVSDRARPVEASESG